MPFPKSQRSATFSNKHNVQLILHCILILVLITQTEICSPATQHLEIQHSSLFYNAVSLSISGSRTCSFSTTNTKAHNCTWSWASSIHHPPLQPTSLRSIFLMVPYIATSKTFPYHTSICISCDYFNLTSYSYLIFPPFLTNLYLRLFFLCLSFLLLSHLCCFYTDFHTHNIVIQHMAHIPKHLNTD